jgi:hypothetical protein
MNYNLYKRPVKETKMFIKMLNFNWLKKERSLLGKQISIMQQLLYFIKTLFFR